MSAICDGGSGTTRLEIPETVSKYVTADRPEATAFPASRKVVEGNPNYTNSPNPIPHTCISNNDRLILNVFCVYTQL